MMRLIVPMGVFITGLLIVVDMEPQRTHAHLDLNPNQVQ
jgi:hypothetical protein